MLGKIISGIGEAVSSVVQTVVGSDSVIGKVANLFGVDDLAGLVLGGPGEWLESICDAVNLPPICGDILGCIANVASGNIPGAISNAIDAAKSIAVSCGGEKLAGFLELGKTLVDGFTGSIFEGTEAFTDIMKMGNAPWRAGGLTSDGIAEQLAPLWMEIFQDAEALFEASHPTIHLRA